MGDNSSKRKQEAQRAQCSPERLNYKSIATKKQDLMHVPIT